MPNDVGAKTGLAAAVDEKLRCESSQNEKNQMSAGGNNAPFLMHLHELEHDLRLPAPSHPSYHQHSSHIGLSGVICTEKCPLDGFPGLLAHHKVVRERREHWRKDPLPARVF